MTFHYLASPYSKYPGGIEKAHADVSREAALLLKAGIPTYCPIAHTHPIAVFGDLDPFDHELWLSADETFMRAAKGLIVCMMDGWEESYGVGVEIKHFQDAGKPVVYMTPGLVPDLTPTRRIIGLAGYARSGKDSAAAALVADGWTKVAFADGVREAALSLNPLVTVLAAAPLRTHLADYVDVNGWELAKQNPEVRELLQRMGTEAGRNIHGPNCWIDLAKRKIDAAPGNVVISDVRFANEAQAIRDWGGIVARIERPGVGPANDHASERLDFAADVTIHNDGTLTDLENSVRSLLVEETV